MTSPGPVPNNGACAWVRRHEGLVLIGLVIAYALLVFGGHGEIQVSADNPGYTDPAINYLSGKGFTSTCWYAQPGSAFWAGNVPLHQFLLLPWLKFFGIHHRTVIWANFAYLMAGVVLFWRATKSSALIRTAEWRLGAIALFLMTESAYFLVTAGRHDPLSFLLMAIACYLLTIGRSAARTAGLLIVAAILPWAHIGAVLFAALIGVLILIFFPRVFWKDVIVFGIGGAIGSFALVGFYHHFHVWDAFIASVAPHITGTVAKSDASWKRAGIVSFDLPFLYAGILFLSLRRMIKDREWRFPLFVLVCVATIPWAFISAAIFSVHYGWFLRLPLIIFLSSLISMEVLSARVSLAMILLILTFEAAAPAQMIRRSVRNRLLFSHATEPAHRVCEFFDKVTKPNDVAWVSPDFYYEAKRKGLKTFSGPVVFTDLAGHSYPGENDDLDSISIYIGTRSPEAREPRDDIPVRLPGKWSPTGEELSAWSSQFIVFRRDDRESIRHIP
jgi:hypothetical protein